MLLDELSVNLAILCSSREGWKRAARREDGTRELISSLILSRYAAQSRLNVTTRLKKMISVSMVCVPIVNFRMSLLVGSLLFCGRVDMFRRRRPAKDTPMEFSKTITSSSSIKAKRWARFM